MTTFEAMETGGEQLRRALRVRHLVMLSVGGTIASGFLLFAGSAIGIAGPAVIISYVIAGIITIAVMACLAELCVVKPVSASFATYARDTMGPLAGFLTGFLSQTNADEAYIHFVGVAPDCQGQGLGTHLYEWFFSTARTHGRSMVRAITSVPNTGSQAFHRRMGFSVSDPIAGYDGRGGDRVAFARAL